MICHPSVQNLKFEISLKRGKKREPLPTRLSLIPKAPLGDKVLRAAIARYIGAVLKGDEHQYSAITGILRRDYPRLQGLTGIGDDPDEAARAIEAIGRLDCSHLLIQGPPGAGKTYTASHAIVEMLARGKRVGVSSHSHKAINNLLHAVETAATDRGLRFQAVLFVDQHRVGEAKFADRGGGSARLAGRCACARFWRRGSAPRTGAEQSSRVI
jgi:hypothetical protein